MNKGKVGGGDGKRKREGSLELQCSKSILRLPVERTVSSFKSYLAKCVLKKSKKCAQNFLFGN